MNSDNDSDSAQRSEHRLNEELLVYVETLSSPEGDGEGPTVVISKTIDVSANGILVRFDYPLIPNSILQLCIESPDGLNFVLMAEVMWQKNVAPHTLIGFQLLESDQTDIGLWKKYIAQRLLDDVD